MKQYSAEFQSLRQTRNKVAHFISGVKSKSNDAKVCVVTNALAGFENQYLLTKGCLGELLIIRDEMAGKLSLPILNQARFTWDSFTV